MSTLAFLLAAGAGTRFNPDREGAKLEALVEGKPIAERAFDALKSAADHLIVAVRDLNTPIALYAQARGAFIIVPPRFEKGMGHSLAACARFALSEFSEKGAAHTALVALADMPWLLGKTCADIAALSIERDAIVQPTYQGVRGHPVAFPYRYWAELTALTGDQGAREILKKYSAEMCLMPVEDKGVILDVDTAQDLL